MRNFAIFVNSSDGFDDCWEPFFKLLRYHAPDLKELPIYLNTETKIFKYKDLNINSTKVAKDNKERLNWSECFKAGLSMVEEEYILYLQEDYFLKNTLNMEYLKDSLYFIQSQTNVGVINLNKHGPVFAQLNNDENKFIEIKKPVKYYLSTQAAIWRKDYLLSLIRPWENGWMFEKFGSFRALNSNFYSYSLNKNIMKNEPVFDYIYTGVIKGKWHTACPKLFKEHDIQIKFSDRGFYQDLGKLKSKFEVIKKLFENPINAFKSFLSIFNIL